MKPFKTYQRLFTLLCVLSISKDSGLWQRIVRVVFGFTIFMSCACALLSSIVYVSKYSKDNLEESIKTIYQIAAYINATYMMIIAFLKRNDIFVIFRRFQGIYDTNSRKPSLKYLIEANDKGEKVIKVFMRCAAGFTLVSAIGGLVLILYSFIEYGHFDSDQLFLSYNYVDPLDRSKLIGWTLEFIYQMISGAAYLVISMIFASFFMTVCFHHMAFCQQMREIIGKLKQEKNEGQDGGKKTLLILCEVVQFHTSTKEIIRETIDLFSGFILIQLLGGVVHIAACIFQLDLALQNVGILLVLAVICVFWSSANTFFYCFFGNSATENIRQINGWLYDVNWHELPNEHQKFFIMLLANSQRPPYFHGSGIANLTLETYAKIMRSVGSYYMAFKAVTT